MCGVPTEAHTHTVTVGTNTDDVAKKKKENFQDLSEEWIILNNNDK